MSGRCPGCGGRFEGVQGVTHPYMLSSPACWARYGAVLAREYGDPALMPTHRLSVDAYAAQHPGRADDRRAVQSVGLHLGRLMLHLDGRLPAREARATMVKLTEAKASLVPLDPPIAFTVTVADMPVDAPPAAHVAAVTDWAERTWADWAMHHAYVRRWVARALG